MAARENLTVGRPDAHPEDPSHVSGVKQGNAVGSYERMAGHNPDGTSTARRSTGINPRDRDPILDAMPNLSPA